MQIGLSIGFHRRKNPAAIIEDFGGVPDNDVPLGERSMFAALPPEKPTFWQRVKGWFK